MLSGDHLNRVEFNPFFYCRNNIRLKPQSVLRFLRVHAIPCARRFWDRRHLSLKEYKDIFMGHNFWRKHWTKMKEHMWCLGTLSNGVHVVKIELICSLYIYFCFIVYFTRPITCRPQLKSSEGLEGGSGQVNRIKGCALRVLHCPFMISVSS